MAQEKEGKPRQRKFIKVNSIQTPFLKRILKPCEARAGHGAISLLIGITVLAGLVVLLIKGAVWVYDWIVS